MTIIEFLEARLAEDEAMARAATGTVGETWEEDYYRVTGVGPVGYDMDAAAIPHVARHDPARVLREVEAKRALILEFVGKSCYSCSSERGGDDIGDRVAWLLASPYSDHPDFDTEWNIA